MAQPMTCTEHGAPGVLYTSTLQGEVRVEVLCAVCIEPWAVALIEGLGLLPALREQIAQELAQEMKGAAAKPKPRKSAAKPAEADAVYVKDPDLPDPEPVGEAG